MPRAFDSALDALGTKLELDAATETSEAFNDEYDAETTALARRESRLYVLPLKIWDVTLDRRLCASCAAHAGETRPWGVPFEKDERPGAVHPRCRCRAATILVTIPGTKTPNDNQEGTRG